MNEEVTKLKGNKYLSTKVIVHNKKRLNEILDNLSNKTLIAEVKLVEESNVMEISNLNLKEGEIYEIVIAEFDTLNSSAGHLLQLNQITSGYVNTHNYNYANNDTVLTGKGTSGLAFTNGFSMNLQLFYTTGILTIFNKDWINFECLSSSSNTDGTNKITIHQSGHLNAKSLNSINSIRVVTVDSTQIGAGSFMKIYKKM